MATIPMGNFGQAVARPAPRPNIPRGNQMGDAVQGLGQVASNVLQDAAQQQNRLGLRAADEQMRKDAEVKAAAQQAARFAAVTQAEDGLEDLHEQIATGVRDGTVPKDKAGEQYRASAAKVVEQMGQALPDTPDKPVVVAGIHRKASRLENRIGRAVADRDRVDVTAGLETSLEYLQRLYRTEPEKAQAQAGALIEQLGPHSTLNPQQVGARWQRWREDTQFTAGYELVSRARDDRKALEAAERALADPKALPDLDPQRRASLQDRAQNFRMAFEQKAEWAAQRQQREGERRLKLAEAEFNTFQAMADRGTALSPDYIDRVMRSTAGTPYQGGVAALARQSREVGGLAAQPVALQQQALDGLNALIAQRGRSPELDARKEQLEKVLAGSRQDLERDALRAGLERGVVTDLQPLDMARGLPGFLESLQSRVPTAQRVGAWAGRPVSPVTADEAKGLAKMLGAMAPDAKGNALGLMMQGMPAEQGQALARQIDAQDRPLALAMAAGASQTTQGRFVSELILRGQQAMRDKAIKVEGGAEFGLKAQVAKEIGDSVPGQARTDLIDAATLIYVGKQAEGDTISMQGAVRLALGGDLIEHNGRRVPVPAGMDGPALQQRLMKMPERAISQQAPDGFVYIPGGRPMGVPEFLAALPGAQLEPAGLGRYVVRSGGGLVLNNQRRPIVVDVR
jgi:hypothetical protein